MSDAITKAASDHELRMRQLQDQLDALERQCTETIEHNGQEEQRLRREKNREENKLKEKISLYDEDMERLRNQLGDLTKTFQEESDEYAVLKEYFDKIDADLAREAAEVDVMKAIQRRESWAKSVLDTAASNILRILRGRKARKEIEALKKKGAKGKKGKKK